MPFGPAYTKTKTFAALGTLLPGDLNSIQDDLGGAIAHRAPLGVVTTLPAGTDGMVVKLQTAAMATDGIVWTFQYRSGSVSANKWEFIGGPEWVKRADPAGGTASGVADLTLTIPVAGEYNIRSGIRVQHNTPPWGCRLEITDSAAALKGDSAWVAVPTETGFARHTGAAQYNGAVAAGVLTGNTVDLGGNPSVFGVWMAVQPIRVA
jgi:hypothetical protein